MNYEQIVKDYAQTRIDLININHDLQDFNKEFDEGEYMDITTIREEFDCRSWTEIVKSSACKYRDYKELAEMLDKRTLIKKQDLKNKQRLLYAGKKLINKNNPNT